MINRENCVVEQANRTVNANDGGRFKSHHLLDLRESLEKWNE
jgi:hypothetical protein